MSVEVRLANIREKLDKFNQGHLLRFWNRLSNAARTILLDEIDQIDLPRCATLIETLVRAKPQIALAAQIDAPVTYAADGPTPNPVYATARAAGEEALRRGRVAAFTVAGGQGTRLGYDGPKGAFRISPVRNAPLFQLFAEQILASGRRYGAFPRWFIMTSPSNDAQTREFFDANHHFGIPSSAISFFPQRQMPAFLRDGRIALAETSRIALSPDGHGGSLRALAESGSLSAMRAAGIDVISYFQVDNPLVRVLDPLFIGLHLTHGSEMSSKAVTKADDLERVGNFCIADGKLCVIEYSDLPESLARARNADGSRKFDAGSIAIHLLSREFVERLTREGSGVQLPWHRADKKVATVDDDGNAVEPKAPNAVKLEQFVFDAIPLAQNPLVLMTRREEEFSPVKNAEGVDSPATARRDMVRRAARWLELAGVPVPRGSSGEPAATIEIDARLALDAQELKSRIKSGTAIEAGTSAFLS